MRDWSAREPRLKLLTVVDEFTRESLCKETRSSIKSRGAYLRSDNGPELLAR